MQLAEKAAALKAQLTQKGGTYRTYRLRQWLSSTMPAGTNKPNEVPTLARYLDQSGGDRDAAIVQYCAAINKTARAFGSFNHTQETLEEHDRYALWIGVWCMISGFGEYVAADKKPGEDDFVKPALESDGSQRVILQHMLVVILLEMASGATSTPKGGQAAGCAWG